MGQVKIKPTWELKGFDYYPLLLSEAQKDYFLEHKLVKITGENEITLNKDWWERVTKKINKLK